jgi:hypothetical protein
MLCDRREKIVDFRTKYLGGRCLTSDAEIRVILSSESAKLIRTLAKEHHYEPTDLVRLGIGAIPTLLRAKALGHKVYVTKTDGEIVKELVLPGPNGLQESSIDEEARKIIENAFPSISLRNSIADLDPDNLKNRKDTDRSPGQSR